MARKTGSKAFGVITAKLAKFQTALASGSSRQQCLRLWSAFVRERDRHRCVDCHSRKRLSAHHICRKSFIAGAQFQTGNGITLCATCHQEMHRGFNGRPDSSLPVDAQGGEKLAAMERLYCLLTDDSVERGLEREDFYFLSDELLAFFKRMQGYDASTFFPGSRIEQAYLILAECEMHTRRAILKANGFTVADHPVLPGGIHLVFDDDSGHPDASLTLRGYRPRSS
jgi:hypothetical protein